ncbi:MAG TPA: glycosyltransferase family 25 protein, partial [Tepidisphaeraceae bacterium]|nr:glycosyltransferase family 25 protein [Tepidisphaeraceae bacterium]
MATPREYFAHAYLINLDSDSDRMSRVSTRLTRLGIPFERFPALPPPEGTATGAGSVGKASLGACAASHRALLQLIADRGHERAIIFEDDVVLRDDAGEWMERMIPQLRAAAWDVFYLGLHLMEDGGAITENLGRVRRGHHLHAYAVTAAAIPKLIACIDRPAGECRYLFDAFDDPTLMKVYARPILAVQEPNFSHTKGRMTNRLPEYFEKFDGEDFLEHCAELRGICSQSDGRQECLPHLGHANAAGSQFDGGQECPPHQKPADAAGSGPDGRQECPPHSARSNAAGSQSDGRQECLPHPSPINAARQTGRRANVEANAKLALAHQRAGRG